MPQIVFEDDGPPLTASDLKEKLRKNLERVIDSFRKFDKDNSGSSIHRHQCLELADNPPGPLALR